MKTLLIFAGVLAATVGCFGAAPDRVDGHVYYESYSIIGVGMARSSTSFAVVLKADGTFTGLFTTSRIFFGGPYLYERPSGSYSYRKIDATTAELTLDGIPQDFTQSTMRTLKFDSDRSGSIPFAPGDMFTNGHAFRIAPLGAAPPLVNCSNRSFVRPGGTAFTGFVVTGSDSRAVLIRAIGPGLAPFGIADPLVNPRVTVINAATNITVVANDDWGSDPDTPSPLVGRADAVKRTGAILGAFPLAENSKDAAVIVVLAPGAYIAQVSSSDAADSGQALIEVYMLP